MNPEKINILDFSGAIASELNMEKSTVIRFMKEYVNLVSDSILKDKILKLSGLGTFKLILIQSRKSIHVVTGQEIEIPAHYKVTFTPEKALKAKLNSSEETKKTNMPNNIQNIDPLEKMAVQANEIKTLLADLQTNMETQKQNPTENTRTKENQLSMQQNTKNNNTEPKQKKHKWWILILILSIFIFTLCLYLSLGRKNTAKAPKIKQPAVTTQQNTPSTKPVEFNIFDQPIDYSQTLATISMSKGTSLAYYAKKYYGHPDFWVYVYEANKDKLTANPSFVLVRAKIRIAKLDARLIDAQNPKAIEHAVQLGQKYIKK